MWKIGELKARGKAAFKANYWKCVLIMVIFSVIGGAIGGCCSAGIFSNGDMMDALAAGDMETYYRLYLGVMGPIMGVTVLASFFLIGPLSIGAGRFFLCNSYAPSEMGELGYAFKKGNYGRSILALFLESLLIYLGTLVIIPGIILTYSYRLVPYILADDPDISAADALKKSRMMMKGHKWRSFVLDLSFIGWIILSAFTLYILLIFWVGPYMAATDAELYRAIKGDGGMPVGNFVPEQPAYNAQPAPDAYAAQPNTDTQAPNNDGTV